MKKEETMKSSAADDIWDTFDDNEDCDTPVTYLEYLDSGLNLPDTL